jgi:alkenylglycerophosphocholine hydrolase
MLTPVFWIAVALAGLDWVGTGFKWRNARLFTKPATLLVLMIWFIQGGGPFWFGLGLMFSLVGDVLLMLPGSRFFISGLVAFLLAHVAYIIGFGPIPLPIHWGSLLALAAVILVGFFDFRRIQAGVCRRADTAQMLVPVRIYGVVISLMLFAALLTLMRPEWPLQAAVYASVGAALFYISDSILACNRFADPIPAADVLVMVSYHAAQFLIAAAVLMAFG